MSVMKRMMDRMVHNMTIEEKERIMLGMIGSMKKDIDIAIVAPAVVKTVGRRVTLTSGYSFVDAARKNNVLKTELLEAREALPVLMKKMQKMMLLMISSSPELFSLMFCGMMRNKIVKVMPIMLPVMKEMMGVMMKEMEKVLSSEESVRDVMPTCMAQMMPNCLETISPYVKEDEMIELKSNLEAILDNRSGSIQGDAKIQTDSLEEKI